MNLQQLHTLIQQACPIDGINSNGDIAFSPTATPQQIAAGKAVFDAAWPIDWNSARDEARAARTAAVAAITITTSTGKVFDGDETSQTRMARAIIGLQAAGVGTISWTLANNQSVTVTVAELTEALILAGQQQAALWPIPE